jgi:trk system potassium uptake protein TrkH
MQFFVIQRITGLLLVLFSITMMPPIIISIISNDGTFLPFSIALATLLLIGTLLWFPARLHRKELRLKDGFIVVALFWVVLGLSGALPLYLSESLRLSFTDSVFESISGLTTTGATVITGLDALPRSILFYRHELQWLGGMGIIVLAVAILPLLGIGGMQLYRAESPGPVKDAKLTPRITETAKVLWYIYLSLTVLCALAYWMAGMSLFDAIGHSFSTISIGGFSTHDQSMGYFNSLDIDAIAVFFMIIAGTNFTLHFHAWRSMSIRGYLQDYELRIYLKILAGVCLISTAYLIFKDTFDDNLTAVTHAIFQTISITTTTGFTTTSYQSWPTFLPVLLIFASFVGACAGSTCGGLKVIRVLLLYKQGIREVRRLVHPNAIITIMLGNKPVDETVINAVWGFFAMYTVVFAFLMLLLLISGLDQVTAFSAMAACLNNLGPGLGDVSANYAGINVFSKWVLCTAMILGRLEIFTLLVLLSPTFWRK